MRPVGDLRGVGARRAPPGRGAGPGTRAAIWWRLRNDGGSRAGQREREARPGPSSWSRPGPRNGSRARALERQPGLVQERGRARVRLTAACGRGEAAGALAVPPGVLGTGERRQELPYPPRQPLGEPQHRAVRAELPLGTGENRTGAMNIPSLECSWSCALG